MRKIFTLAILCALPFLSSAFGSNEWYLLKSDGYEIAFPLKPEAETNTIPSGIGELTLSMHIYDASSGKTKDENLVYLSNTTDFPDSLVNSDKKENHAEIFRNAIDGAVKNVEGKLLSEKVIGFSGFPGREFRIDLQNGAAVITAQCFLVKNRMYILQVITETKKAPNATMEKFFNSFRLTKAG